MKSLEALSHTPDQSQSDDTPTIRVAELTPNDYPEYVAKVQADKFHLELGGLSIADWYKTPEDVAEHHDPDNGISRRGIWYGDILAGGIDVTPVEGNENQKNVNYWVVRSHVRKGIASTALKMVVEEHANLGISLRAETDTDNKKSRNTLYKAGFHRVGVDDLNDRYILDNTASLVQGESHNETDSHLPLAS